MRSTISSAPITARTPNNATLLAVFNQGYTPGASVPRCVGQGTNYTVVRMPCYCPVAFAGLRKLPDTLGSRTIRIQMKRRTKDEPVESFRRRYHVPEAEPIKNALIDWCVQIEESILSAFADGGPEMPAGIDGAAQQTAGSYLLAIAMLRAATGRSAPAPSRLPHRRKTDDNLTSGVELLDHVRDAFLDADSILTDTLIDRLCGRDESPWESMGKLGKRHRPHPGGHAQAIRHQIKHRCEDQWDQPQGLLQGRLY